MSTPLPEKRKDWLPPPRAARAGGEPPAAEAGSRPASSLPPPRQKLPAAEPVEREEKRLRPPFPPPGAVPAMAPAGGVSVLRRILGVGILGLFAVLVWYLTKEIPKAAALEEASQAKAVIIAQRLWMENGFVPELEPVSPLQAGELADLPRLFSEIRKNLTAQPRIDVLPTATTGLWECNYASGPQVVAVVRLQVVPESGVLSFLSATADPRLAKPFEQKPESVEPVSK